MGTLAGCVGVFLYEVQCVSIQLGGKACISVSVNLLKSKCEYLLTGVSPDLSSSLILTTSVLDRG